MKLGLSLLLIVFSILGIADASYITWEKLSGRIPPCSGQFKCADVLTSQWSNVGPVPLSVLGIAFYSGFLLLGVLFYLSQESPSLKPHARWLSKLMLAWGAFGALFSLYLMVIMGVVIQAWCLYCLLSAINCAVLFVISSTIYKLTSKSQAAPL